MKFSLDSTLISVWQQPLVENSEVVKLGGESCPVTRSKAKRLRQVAFDFDGESFIGIEQNPKTKSRWAAMARAGKKVMQFIQDGRYVAVVADGKLTLYSKRATRRLTRRSVTNASLNIFGACGLGVFFRFNGQTSYSPDVVAVVCGPRSFSRGTLDE